MLELGTARRGILFGDGNCNFLSSIPSPLDILETLHLLLIMSFVSYLFFLKLFLLVVLLLLHFLEESYKIVLVKSFYLRRNLYMGSAHTVIVINYIKKPTKSFSYLHPTVQQIWQTKSVYLIAKEAK